MTTVHQPFDVRIFQKQCRTLAGSGYQVYLVAPHSQSEEVDGIRLQALPRRAHRLSRFLFGVSRAFVTALRCRGTVYHLHDPELLPLGVLFRLLGATVLYDVHEDYPGSIRGREYVPGRLRRPLAGVVAALEWMAGRVLSGFVAATPPIARRFPPRKTVTVMNYPDVREFAKASTEDYARRPPHAVYIGGIDRNRGALQMIRAIGLLADDGVRLVLAGRPSPSTLLKDLACEPGWERVRYLGWQNRQEIAGLLAEVRIGLLVLQPTPAYVDSYPVKLFEYMAAGLPVVASDFPFIREVVNSAGAGLLVDPADAHAIAAAVRWLLTHPAEAVAMGRRGQETVRQRYTWASQASILTAFYGRFVTPGKR